VKVASTVLSAAWRAPLTAAHGGADAPRPLVLLRLQGADGVEGLGEAAPLESYDGVSVADVLGDLEACGPVLAAADGGEPATVLAACRAEGALPQALAAIDLALWDMAGRRARRPVWSLLGATAPPVVAVNAVIGAEDRDRAAAEARAAVLAGYRCVKVKVGLGDDAARVAAVRTAVGPDVAIRVDANGAWLTAAAAVSALAELSRFDLELCEEPVHGARAIGEVAVATTVPIAVDESTADPESFTARCADLMCLKIAASGGISGVLADAERARALGYAVFLASTLDGPLGIAAALHVAAALGPDRPSGLSTLNRFATPPPFGVTGAQLTPPPGPGLGDGLLEWYAALTR
jgi:L-alanine-DL-glutamate epimerase-like enolase superfamily enzyme